MVRALSIVLASCAAVLVAPCLPAVASTALPTFIEDFASSVTTVTYQQPVTFTGVLLETSAKVPAPNETVQVQFEPQGAAGYTPVATATTGPDGQFAMTTTLPSGGLARAVFAGDSDLAPSYSSPWWGLNLDANHLPSRLELDPVPTSVPAGTPVVFSGTMQVQVNGTWESLAGQPLILTMERTSSSEPNETFATSSGADGTFSLTEPVTETSDWVVETGQGGYYLGDWYPDYARAFYDGIDGVSKTEIVGFGLPARSTAQDAVFKGVYATGSVQRWNGSSWVGLTYGFIDVYYRPKGSSTWHLDQHAQTNVSGQFKVAIGVHLGTSSWQIRVRSAADTLTSTSATLTSTMNDRTHLAGVEIKRTAGGVSVDGQVSDLYRNTTFRSLQGRTIRLYYRRKGSSTWHYYLGTRVLSGGYFGFDGARGYGYYFKVVFPAQGVFTRCASRTL